MVEMAHGVLERRLKSKPITDPVRRALINLQIAEAHFEEDFEAAVGTEGLGASAYNVLRILRGEPEGHPRGAIADRMVYRKTDLTRIIDRLVRLGFAERVRSKRDRRLSVTRITQKGVKAMARLEPLVDGVIDQHRRKLPAGDFQELNRLLEALYVDRLE